MGKKKLQKRIGSLERLVREHQRKIAEETKRANKDEGLIRHWEIEIKAFEEGLRRAKKRLGEKIWT